MNQLNLNLTASRAARDKGIGLVRDANYDWCSEAVEIVRSAFLPGTEITGETVRSVVQMSIGGPKNPNGWGAIIRTMAVRCLIKDTGRSTQAKLEGSHARRLPIWVIA
jgi:hypothetical protein